jgi:ParB family chromosome partitioning protein
MAEEGRRLGRGLAALIGDRNDSLAEPAAERPRGQRKVPIEFVRPNPRNPRKSFDEDQLAELADSIRERGLIQPIVVRAMPNMADTFEIIAGERRWRAAQRAGLHDVPIVILEATDQQSLELAIVENVQRADLNPLEEAKGYDQLIQEFAYTQQDLAKIIGKSRSHVANTLRLVNLPDGVKKLVANGSLSAGHARALLSVKNPEAVASRIVAQGLSVRDVEKLAAAEQAAEQPDKPKSGPKRSPSAQKDADTRALERVLSDVLGMTVTIDHQGDGGEVRIEYRTLDQLDAICQRLKQ